ncbi:hypothetical protein E2I00_009596, partial [Balaenoptera physalus]
VLDPRQQVFFAGKDQKEWRSWSRRSRRGARGRPRGWDEPPAPPSLGAHLRSPTAASRGLKSRRKGRGAACSRLLSVLWPKSLGRRIWHNGWERKLDASGPPFARALLEPPAIAQTREMGIVTWGYSNEDKMGVGCEQAG